GFAAHAFAPLWPVFAAGAALIGLGSGAVDAALNAFVAREFSARQMNWLHACYSAGAWIGPLLMAAAIHRGSWRGGYAVLGAVLLALAGVFILTSSRWGRPAAPGAAGDAGAGAALRHPRVRLQMAVFFVYTGLESTFGAWAYTVLVEGRGLAHATAVGWVALYFGALAAGRVLFGIVVGRWNPDRLVRAGAWGAATGAALFAVGPETVQGASLGLVGLSLAPVFPCLMARTPDRVGHAAAVHAIGFQVSAATLGAALCPALGGLLSDAAGLRAVPVEAVVLAALLCALHERLLLGDR
ncbi:MAG TPA: MFS transporter, partial [Planctomycetota bacterium]|nr:MFS transporter [Planctomycetota bacterium]